MNVTQSLISFILAAALLTITPGLDSALVLRTAAVEGTFRAVRAGFGIVAGCLACSGAIAVGLGALLAASATAFVVLKWIGVCYLVWLGIQMIQRPRSTLATADQPDRASRHTNWVLRGLLQNLLNPKVGVFYISFLPQFVPAAVPAASWMLLLAGIHAALGLLWFGVLITATRPIVGLLRRPPVLRAMDRLTGLVFLGFGAKLALSRR